MRCLYTSWSHPNGDSFGCLFHSWAVRLGKAIKARLDITNLGISLQLDGKRQPLSLLPRPGTDQQAPKDSYVYAHVDKDERPFYFGQGTNSRAWSKDRHPLWIRYVENHLANEYAVRILADGLSQNEADELEAGFIAQFSDALVNWVSMGRTVDYKALEQFHNLRDANRALMQQAKRNEKDNREAAISVYQQVIANAAAYAFISFEKGLVGELLKEEAAEIGHSGELEALDRLTICLVKLGRNIEATAAAERYFATYRRDLNLKAAKRIQLRVRPRGGQLGVQPDSPAPGESAG